MSQFKGVISLIFESGLSTADKVTDTSGRGVGMDAVRALIEELGGSISIYSEIGSGSQFEIDIPLAAKLIAKVA